MNQQTSVSERIRKIAGFKPKSSRRRSSGDRSDGSRYNLSDIALLLILFIAPLAMGGRTELGRALYVFLVALLSVAFFFERSRRSSGRWYATGVEWMLLAGGVILAIQLVPLPSSWLQTLAPALSELLPLWDTGAGGELSIGEWNRLSLTPHATMFAVCVYVAHVLLFIVLVQKMESMRDVERVVRWVALAVVSIATLGIIQYLTGTEEFVWVFKHPSRDANRMVCGPFSNSNHFAHFLALGIGPLVWWTMKSYVPPRRGPTGNVLRVREHDAKQQAQLVFLSIGIGVVVFAALLARSRGGSLMLMVASSVAVFGFVAMGAMPKRILWLLGGVAVAVSLSLFIHGSDLVKEEMESLASIDIEELDKTQGRRRIWAANMEVAERFRWLGTGVGSHAEIYHTYFPHPSRVEYKHAESGYINVMTETGVAGLGLVIFGLLCCFSWCYRAIKNGPGTEAVVGVALLAGILVSALHAVFDFHWYLASCMSLTVVLAACACRLSQDRRNSEQGAMPKVGWHFGLVASCAFLALAVAIQFGPAMASLAYNDYLCISLGAKRANALKHGQRLASDEMHEEEQRRSYDRNRVMAEHLIETLKWDAYHPRANLRLAHLFLNSFDYLQKFSPNAMGLSQISDAATASGFPTREAQDKWLDAAVGDNLAYLRAALEHAKRGLAGSPMSGRGYLYWADLAFLERAHSAIVQRLYEQALATRPYDAGVLFALGRESALARDAVQAMAYWKRSFHQSDEYRDVIIRQMATWLPPQVFVEYFEPDRRELTRLVRFYTATGMEQQARVVAPALIERLEAEAAQLAGNEASKFVIETIGLCKLIGDYPRALKQSALAVQLAPNSYEPRRIYAYQLLAMEQYDAAIEQFAWCIRRRPSDEKVKQSINVARNLRRKSQGLAGRVDNQSERKYW